MRVVLVEMRKAFLNRWFALALAVGCSLALVSAIGSIALYNETLGYILESWGFSAPLLSASSCFRFIMTSDYVQGSTDLFYALLPLLAALPYSWSLCAEKSEDILTMLSLRRLVPVM